jgi:hypothetical protein
MSEPKLDDYNRSKQSESDGSIESMTPNPKHSGFMSAGGDLPSPPVEHPSSEGIFRRRGIIGYERYLKELARKLRQNMTLGEVLL